MSEPKGNVLPIYFVADESGSMESVVDELNRGLTNLLDALQTETMAAAKVRFSVIGFSDETLVHLPMADLRRLEKMPMLRAGGTTSYESAFRTLATQIPRDVAQLKADGYLVNRPAVFFLSDGYPNEENWRSALNSLKDPGFRERPNILAFGLGAADPKTMVEVASKEEYAFQAAEGSDTGLAIARFCEALTQSVVSSGQALASGNAELQGERPEGFKMAVDLI